MEWLIASALSVFITWMLVRAAAGYSRPHACLCVCEAHAREVHSRKAHIC